ncbi:DUF2169 family type VI secretion system accessory protein [Acerihabitans arboris]|uniref:DUF2169 domain-containing protein n=1 Tax=Acerihabitans arboris TaxID=2691583 RepID=A0A845SKA8_9GAMM|nr:DUF2169 domain-containing protein [Acerihabitans arboris]NDL64399.1 DUF2169 domain-containing protein [Acerihabitans arboris]
MKIIKPLRLGVLHRPWRWLGQNQLGVSVLALADMGPAPRLRPEPELWQLAARELAGDGGLLDLAIPKARAEFLATGYAYTRHQRQKNACMVKIQVGELEKCLMAFGERFWINGRPTEPLPFEQLRLDWENAFGGENNAGNPRGLGAQPIARNGALCHPLAHIEPVHLGYGPQRRRIKPDCFGPLDFCLPEHFKQIGKGYDSRWLAEDYPGFARDIDWGVFNRAGRDQRWPQSASLPAGAPWRIWNMHPDQPLQQGVVPDWRARCFITRAGAGAAVPGNICSARMSPGPEVPGNHPAANPPALEEIALRATTLWFFPHLQQMALIWQGSCAINEDDALDVDNMLVAVEAARESRPPAHYQAVFQSRSQKATGAAHALREQDLVAESLIGPWLDTAARAPDSPLVANLARREACLRETHRETLEQGALDTCDPLATTGLASADDPDTSGKQDARKSSMPGEKNAAGPDIRGREPVPRPGELPEYMARVELRAAALQRRALNKAAALGADIAGLMNDAGSRAGHGAGHPNLGEASQSSGIGAGICADDDNPGQRSHKVEISTGESAMKDADAPSCSGPAQYHRMLALLRRREEQSPDADPAIDTPEARHSLHQIYRLSADTRPPAPPLDAGETDAVRRRLQALLAHTRDLGGMDLTGADLSDMDLRGVNLQRALLESARLDNCLLDGANLSEAMLAHASLVNVSLCDARLNGTCLTGARCLNSRFSGACLDEVSLTQATLADCCFDRAQLSRLLFYHTTLDRCRFSRAALNNCTFLGPAAAGLDFSHCRLEKVTFNDGRLGAACFNAAQLANCAFIGMNLDETQFQEAHLDSCVFTAGTHARRATFQRARLISCNLRHTPLDRADWSRARAEGCDFSAAGLTDACLDGINADGCLFIRADLTRASLNRADLLGAQLQKARLAGADLRAANLFRADLSLASIDRHTRLQGAYTHQCKTLPRAGEPSS